MYTACKSPACLHTMPYFPEEKDSTVPQQQTQTLDCFRCRAIFSTPSFSRATANKPRWSSLSVNCMGPGEQLWVPMTQVWLGVTEGCGEDYRGGYKVALGEIKGREQKTWGEVERSGAPWLLSNQFCGVKIFGWAEKSCRWDKKKQKPPTKTKQIRYFF